MMERITKWVLSNSNFLYFFTCVVCLHPRKSTLEHELSDRLQIRVSATGRTQRRTSYGWWGTLHNASNGNCAIKGRRVWHVDHQLTHHPRSRHIQPSSLLWPHPPTFSNLICDCLLCSHAKISNIVLFRCMFEYIISMCRLSMYVCMQAGWVLSSSCSVWGHWCALRGFHCRPPRWSGRTTFFWNPGGRDSLNAHRNELTLAKCVPAVESSWTMSSRHTMPCCPSSCSMIVLSDSAVRLPSTRANPRLNTSSRIDFKFGYLQREEHSGEQVTVGEAHCTTLQMVTAQWKEEGSMPSTWTCIMGYYT